MGREGGLEGGLGMRRMIGVLWLGGAVMGVQGCFLKGLLLLNGISLLEDSNESGVFVFDNCF